MTIGDAVSVWPIGQPERAETGQILTLSDNPQTAAVVFDELPLFLAQAVRDDPDYEVAFDERNGRIVMVLSREAEGPWLDVGGCGFYEMMVPV